MHKALNIKGYSLQPLRREQAYKSLKRQTVEDYTTIKYNKDDFYICKQKDFQNILLIRKNGIQNKMGVISDLPFVKRMGVVIKIYKKYLDI